MRPLTGREKRFLKEAKKHAPNKDDVFGVAKVGVDIGMSSVEAHDIVRVLERDFGEVGYVRRVPGDKSDGLGEGVRAVLTDLGREFPIQAAEDEATERKARRWRIGHRIATGLLAVVTGVSIAWLNRKIERSEKAAQQRVEQESKEKMVATVAPATTQTATIATAATTRATTPATTPAR